MADDRLDQQAGFLPWEDDLEMISKYLDRKASESDVFSSSNAWYTYAPHCAHLTKIFLDAALCSGLCCEKDSIYLSIHDEHTLLALK